FTNIQWARLYVNVYSGSGSANWPSRTTISLDGNGDGTYETTLGVENMSMSSYSGDGKVYWLNDHTNRVYSDYETEYDVTSLITSATPSVHVKNEKTGSLYDGRLKAVTLVVAYNDGDTDQVRYFVNHGGDWFNSGSSSTTFGTAGIASGFTNATLSNVGLSSSDATYAFNGVSLAGADPVAPINYYENHTWSVKDAVSTAANSVFQYSYVAPSFKTTLATLAIKYPGTTTIAPVASFSANMTSGTVPFTVAFTDASTNSPTAWSWDFNNDGTVDSTTQNATYTFLSAGTYTVNLTATNTAGSSSSVQADYITAGSGPVGSAPVAAFSADKTTGTYPLTVSFTDASTNTPTSWAWDFGDGNVTNATVRNPVHTYTNAGTYTVNLTATNAAGSDYENKAGHITVTGSASNDLAITGTVDTAPVAAVFAREANTVTVTDITNTGTTAVTNIEVGLYAGDVSSSVPVNTITIASLAGGATTTVSLIDPTIRDLEGGTVTYTAAVDPANLIAETNETNNNQTTASKPVKFNGYKGKGIYWNGGSNITTKHTYDLNGDVLYSTQPATAYKGQGWATRTETWSAGNLPVPSGATIQKVFLYINYNWDQTPAGVPNMTATFNGNTVVLGTPYMDKSNFGSYANYKYGLYPAIDVTTRFVNGGDNTLVMTPGTGNKNALYPSTLVVIYADPTATRKQIFINEECDELGTSPSGYSTTLEEATAYAPFTGLTIDTASVRTATLHSFAGSAGPSEGNLLFNGATVATAAWQGSSSTASARSFDVRSYLTGTGNEAAIQGDTSGGMDALMQILVVEYATTVSAPVSAFTTGTTTGTAPFTVIFTDASTNTPTSWLWDFGDNDATNSTKQNPVHTYQSAGTYTVNLTVTNAAGSDREEKTGYVIVTAAGPGAAPVASFSTNVAAGLAPLSVQFTDSSATNPTAWSWDFNNDGVVDSIEESPTHLFSTAGIYTVNLSVTNASGTTTLTKPNLIAVSSGVDRLATDQSGTVSGDLYVGAYQPVAWSSQSTTPGLKTFAQAYTLPAHTDIQWARLYAVVYAAGTDNRAGEAAVTFDRDGDGTYETALGTETLAIPATGTAEVYRVNDHVTRQYSDYLIWYNVTPYISANTVNAQIVTRNLNSSTFDGRLKTLTLVVAYNDGDSDQVHYWVNDGHDYQVKTDSAVTSAFATGSLAPGWTTAVLTNLGLSSQDAIYSFNSNELARQGSGLPSFATNTWDVKSYLTAGTDTSFTYQHNTSTTYKTILATLTVKYSAAAPVAPVAAFSATPVSGTAPLAVTFTDASTNAPTSWLWDFGDGNVTNATNQNPVHTYIAAGNYSVNLTATNAAGSDSEARTRYITVTASSVTPDKPVASFRANKTEGDQPLAVKFTDASTNTPTSWLWDFGDSGSSTEQNPVHTYIAAGNYSVNLTATNLAGSDSEARTRYITVTASSVTPDKPVASFRANKTEGDQPLVVKFTDASTNTPTSWSWDFGDSGSSAEQNPVHRYTTTGTYTVSLTATNAAGSNQVTRTRYISVIAPVVENNGFVIPEIETTTTGTTQNVTINSTSANVTTTGNVVTINNTASWSSLAITLSGTPETGTGTINGTVETVRAVTEPVTVPLAEVGTPTVQIALDLDAMPNTTAAITQTITKEPDSTAQSSFTLLASADGKQIDDIAYTINIAKTDLKNAGDGGIIQSATLTMTVSPAWVAAQGGFGNIRVLRRADDGTTQILVPVLAGTDASGNYILTVVSPGGLSTFSLASLSPVTSTTTSGSASTSGSSTASASTSAGIETSSADPADSSVISSSSSTAQKAPLDPSAYPWSSHAVNGNTHISQVDIQTTASIPDLFILTTKPDSLPSAIAKPSYPVYEYQKIDLYKATSDDVYQAVIEFTVSKSYLDEQKMTFHDVQLLRYTNKAWEPLPTEYVGVRNGDYVFKATSSGFSYFATALVKNATSVTVTEVTTTVTPGITVTPETTVVTSRKTAVPTIAKTLAAPLETPEAPTTPLPMVIFGIAGIIVLAISVVVIRKWWIRRQNPALFRKY
ncbi:DUF3344 domain-containing protein, partial [Methanoregula sp.]|uniref:DUF3344 domain-containing protein n=1 Tax=Methanoregula sp. TaxID=2052170 RepID=UPI002372FB46